MEIELMVVEAAPQPLTDVVVVTLIAVVVVVEVVVVLP